MRKSSAYFIQLFVLLMTAGFFSAAGQNKVPNPGFEMQDSCPAVSEIFVAPPWNSPTLGTPDLLNDTCSSQNFSGRTGHGSSGIFLYNTFPNNREYIQAPLTSALTASQSYHVSFWVKNIGDYYAVNKIGAYFSVGAINQTTTSNLSFTPQVQNPSSNMLSSSGWMQVSGYFIASGGETHIIIGNFSTDANTSTAVFNSSSSNMVSYYQIDDISVTPGAVGINDPELLSELIQIYPQPVNDEMHLRFPPEAGIKNVTLLDNCGRATDRYSLLKNSQGEIIFDLSAVASGLYFLSIRTETAVLNKKIIVER